MTLHARDGHFPMEEQPETGEGEGGGPRRRARGEQNSKVTGGQPAEPAFPPLHHPPSPNAATDAVAECIPLLSSRLINKAKKKKKKKQGRLYQICRGSPRLSEMRFWLG